MTEPNTLTDNFGVTLDPAAPLDSTSTTSGAITFPASGGSDSKTLIGGTIGAGVAYALNDHWDVGAEYRFTDYGRAKFALGTVAGGFFGGAFENVPATGSLSVQTQQVELKVNYRF